MRAILLGGEIDDAVPPSLRAEWEHNPLRWHGTSEREAEFERVLAERKAGKPDRNA